MKKKITTRKPRVKECPQCGTPITTKRYEENLLRVCEQEWCKEVCCDYCSEVYADGKRYCRCTSPDE